MVTAVIIIESQLREMSALNNDSRAAGNNRIMRNAQELSDVVTKAATSSKKFNSRSSSLTQLNIANMNLHGREDDMKLLKTKLREFTKEKSNHELILIAGESG